MTNQNTIEEVSLLALIDDYRRHAARAVLIPPATTPTAASHVTAGELERLTALAAALIDELRARYQASQV